MTHPEPWGGHAGGEPRPLRDTQVPQLTASTSPGACEQRCLPPDGRVPAIMSPAERTSRVRALWAEPSCPSVLFMSLKMVVLSHQVRVLKSVTPGAGPFGQWLRVGTECGNGTGF